MPHEIGEFLSQIGEAPLPRTPAGVEGLIELGKKGRLNGLEVEDLIKNYGFKPEQFSEMPGAWFKLNVPQGDPQRAK